MPATTSYAFPADACGFARGATGCTANDTGIVQIALDPAFSGTDPTSCTVGGPPVTIHLLVTVATTATARYNLGVLLAKDGKNPTVDPSSGGAATCYAFPMPLTSPFSNLDANACGDLTSAAGNSQFNAGAVTVPCVAGPGGLLQIPGVAVWEQQPGTPTSCTGPTTLAPGTSSKCKVSLSQTIPVTVSTPTGSVQLIKNLVPTSDPGLFNLSVASPNLTTATASNVGNGGNATLAGIAGSAVVTLGETAGTGTNLANYTTTFSCNQGLTPDGNNQITMPAETSSGIVCTVTNTRKGRTVNVFKALNPAGDPGKFNLLVNGSPVATDQGDGGTGFATGIAVASSVAVTEAGGTGTSLANYTSSLVCLRADNQAQVSTTSPFTMPDADVNCTFTNTRIAPRPAIPALSDWMLLLLGVLLFSGAWLGVRRRR